MARRRISKVKGLKGPTPAAGRCHRDSPLDALGQQDPTGEDPVLHAKTCISILLMCLASLLQTNSGELHLRVTDPSGLGVKTIVHVTSEANQYRSVLTTSDQGSLNVQRLPYGIYQLEIEHPGFAPMAESVEIHSTLPMEYRVQLKLPTVNQSVTVSADSTLIDPDQAGSVSQIGTDFIQNRSAPVPGRSLQDLVNSQPGWLYEGNAVLHPRGSEYQNAVCGRRHPLNRQSLPKLRT